MPSLEAYAESRREHHLEELMALLRIPSVSTDPSKRADVASCARVVCDAMCAAGLDVEIHPTAGHPIVYGERLAAPGKPTVLVYGHYDVQPPEPLELWRHGPFTPTIEDGFLVARGATDDKGQFYALLNGIEAALAVHGELGVNVKMLIEGEEEIGSPNLAPFVSKQKDLLACDVIVIADSSQYARGIPAITYGLKGLCYLELIVRGPGRDLHSGAFGGSVANPANVLADMISKCFDESGRCAIPGFYDAVRPLEDDERREWKELPFSEAAYLEMTGAKMPYGETGYTTLERRWGRPTFDVNGLLSGFTGEGAKTVLPAEARAKFSMRLVADQDWRNIASLAKRYLAEIAPEGVSIEILEHHGGDPVLAPREGPFVDAAITAMTRAFGRKPVFIREGGSIPIVDVFKKELGADSLLLGLGLPDDGAHSPNERFNVEDFHRGAIMMASFLEAAGG